MPPSTSRSAVTTTITTSLRQTPPSLRRAVVVVAAAVPEPARPRGPVLARARVQPLRRAMEQRPVQLQVLRELGYDAEYVVWCGKLVKVNRSGKSQERTFVLTQRCATARADRRDGHDDDDNALAC